MGTIYNESGPGKLHFATFPSLPPLIHLSCGAFRFNTPDFAIGCHWYCRGLNQKLIFIASRNCRSPPSTLLLLLNALVMVMKPPDETFAAGLLKCGVLETL